MNFTDYTVAFSKEFGVSQRTARKMITFLTKKLKHDLIFGVQISFREIGMFRLKKRQPKKYLNLQTGKMGLSKLCYYLDFKATKKMIKRLKDKTVH